MDIEFGKKYIGQDGKEYYIAVDLGEALAFFGTDKKGFVMFGDDGFFYYEDFDAHKFKLKG